MNTKQVMPPPTRISAFQRHPRPDAYAHRLRLTQGSGSLIGTSTRLYWSKTPDDAGDKSVN